MRSCGANCSRLRDGHECEDVIEIGRFPHAQPSSAAPIIDLRSSIWNKGEFAIHGTPCNPGDPGHRAGESVSVNALFDINFRTVGTPGADHQRPLGDQWSGESLAPRATTAQQNE
jgi:hypothetical protein